MTSNVLGSRRIKWVDIVAWTIAIFCIASIIGYIVIGCSEGNGMVILGLISLIIGVWVCAESDWDKKDGRFWRYAWPVVLFLFFLVSPFIHVADTYKVWVVGDRTTLGSSVLFRLPFTASATSVGKKQNVSFNFIATTKENIPVSGTVTADFRLTDDDKELASSVAGIENPEGAIRIALQRVLGKAFGDAIARRSVVDVASLPNTFMLELDVGTATTVRQLGLRRNGSLVVSGVRPYFFDH